MLFRERLVVQYLEKRPQDDDMEVDGGIYINIQLNPHLGFLLARLHLLVLFLIHQDELLVILQ